MDIDNYVKTGEQFLYSILYVLFILDCMNTVGITALNVFVNVFILV